jgi:hypothetical protein
MRTVQLHNSFLKIAFTVIALCIITAASFSTYVPVVFRYDDYCASDDDRRMFVDRKVIDIHERYGTALVIGVVPAENPDGEWPTALLAEDHDRMMLLLEAIEKGFVEVGLHGYNHANLAEEGPPSEFRGISRHEQSRRIDAGKKYLEEWLEIEVDAFIPPFNTYDETTVELLQEKGFRVVSAAFGSGPDILEPMVSVPCWIEFSTIDIFLVFRTAEKRSAFTPIVLLFHSYDFVESGDERAVLSLDEYEKIVAYVASSNRLQASTLTAVSNDTAALEIMHSDGVKKIFMLSNMVRFIPDSLHDTFYGVFFFMEGLIGLTGLIVLVYAFLIIVGLLFSLFLSRILKKRPLLWRGFGLVLFTATLVLVIQVGEFQPFLFVSSARYLLMGVATGMLSGSILIPILNRFALNSVRSHTE